MKCPRCQLYLSSLSGGHCARCGWNANGSSAPLKPGRSGSAPQSPKSAPNSRFAVPLAVVFGLVCVLGFAGMMSELGQGASQSAAMVSAKTGPPFHELDAVLDQRQGQYTQAQRAAAWKAAQGTWVQWEGEVVECEDTSGGQIELKCNAQTQSYDTVAFLDGTQSDSLSSLTKGSRIVIEGILKSHDEAGYTINQARFEPVS